MDQCRLTIAASGGYFHPFFEPLQIDGRYYEVINTPDIPHRQMLVVTDLVAVPFGSLVNPRALIVWNMTGVGLQSNPPPEERARIDASELDVGLTDDESRPPTAWLRIRPATVGWPHGGNQILYLAPGTRVMLRPVNPGHGVTAKILVIPGAK